MILITGATGFIGRSLTAALDRQQTEWRAYHGRINNPLTLREQLEGVDIVIHLAGAEARGRDRLLHHVDIEGTERLIEESQKADVRQIIFPSRIGANPLSLHPLLRVKGEVEQRLRRSGVPYTILPTASLYGRHDRHFEIILGLALWSWPFVWLPGGGAIPMQPLWVEDYVRCLIATIDHPACLNQTLTVVGEERLNYRKLVQTLLRAAGLRRIPITLPMLLLHPVSAIGFSWWWWPAVSRYFVDRFFVPEVASFDSVIRQFNFHPARIEENLTYLNRPGLRWRLFRH